MEDGGRQDPARLRPTRLAEPPELFVSDGAGETASRRQLTHLNDEIVNEVDLRPAERIWVNGAAGAKIDVFLVKPHGFDPSPEISAHS